jgi:hypothetical protein
MTPAFIILILLILALVGGLIMGIIGLKKRSWKLISIGFSLFLISFSIVGRYAYLIFKIW